MLKLPLVWIFCVHVLILHVLFHVPFMVLHLHVAYVIEIFCPFWHVNLVSWSQNVGVVGSALQVIQVLVA